MKYRPVAAAVVRYMQGMEPSELTLGFSSCPNDTFMFEALVHGRVRGPKLPLGVVMQDIEALNRRALGEEGPPLAVTKLSVAALGRVLDRYVVLGAGAALGHGCGPLVVAKPDADLAGLPAIEDLRVAVPGVHTTAYLLLRIFAPDFEPIVMRFDEIMPAVAAGQCDAGLIIHESRFTYPEHGLAAVADLGEVWEAQTDAPLPLGVIAARRDLEDAHADALEAGLRASVEHARTHPEDAWPYVREHAQEMDESVCRRHIDLYVNDFSVDLGQTGRAAIETLLRRGMEIGLLPSASFAEGRDLFRR